MYRRRKGLIDELLELASKRPILGLIGAMLLAVGGLYLREFHPGAFSGMGRVLAILLWMMAGLLLIAAGIGWITHSLSRRKFRQQRTLEDIHELTWREFEQFIAD